MFSIRKVTNWKTDSSLLFVFQFRGPFWESELLRITGTAPAPVGRSFLSIMHYRQTSFRECCFCFRLFSEIAFDRGPRPDNLGDRNLIFPFIPGFELPPSPLFVKACRYTRPTWFLRYETAKYYSKISGWICTNIDVFLDVKSSDNQLEMPATSRFKT